MNLNKVKTLVVTQLGQDKTGHSMDHIDRVLSLSLEFAKPLKADKDLITLIALLHDVDDYKLVGIEKASLYENSLTMMHQASIPHTIQTKVINQIKRLGYSRYLEGIRPTTLEGQIVSDADMCDAIGANGLLRVYAYGRSKGQPFFNRDVFPTFIKDATAYRQSGSDYTIHHFFDKLLNLKDLMMTNPGKKEAKKRHQYMVDFLMQFFEEENAPAWQDYLTKFLKR